MTCGAIPVTRGCGNRKRGGIYFESGLSASGQPVEYFLCDPPVLVDDWHLSPVGVQLISRNGITHIIRRFHKLKPALLDCLWNQCIRYLLLGLALIYGEIY